MSQNTLQKTKKVDNMREKYIWQRNSLKGSVTNNKFIKNNLRKGNFKNAYKNIQDCIY